MGFVQRIIRSKQDRPAKDDGEISAKTNLTEPNPPTPVLLWRRTRVVAPCSNPTHFWCVMLMLVMVLCEVVRCSATVVQWVQVKRRQHQPKQQHTGRGSVVSPRGWQQS